MKEIESFGRAVDINSIPNRNKSHFTRSLDMRIQDVRRLTGHKAELRDDRRLVDDDVGMVALSEIEVKQENNWSFPSVHKET